MNPNLSGLILIAVFFAVMIGLILLTRRAAKNFKKEGKVSSIEKLRKLQ